MGEVGQEHAATVEVPPVDLLLSLGELEAEVLEVIVREQLITAPASGRVLVQASVTQSNHNSCRQEK